MGWLSWGGKWNHVAASLSHLSLGWFGVALLTYLAGQSLCGWKWGVLASSLGFRQPLRFYWVNYLAAMFPSLFLPTTVGGDVYRTVALAQQDGRKVEAGVSVLADRGTGVLAMAWIAAIACLLLPGGLPAVGAQAIYWLCGALTLGFVAPFFVRPAFARRGLLGKALACWDQPGPLLLSLGAAFVFQASVGLIYVFLGRALALDVPLSFYFLLSPLVSIAAMSPITINGLGERTAALVLLFQLQKVGADRAVAFGLAWTGMSTLAALFGGLVLLIDRQSGTEPVEESAAV